VQILENDPAAFDNFGDVLNPLYTMAMVLTFENIYYTVGGGSWVQIQEKDPAAFDNFGGLTVLVDGEAQVVESQSSRLLQYFWLIV